MKNLKINDYSCAYLCDKCDDEHLDIEIQVIIDDVELLNLKNSNNYNLEHENNFLLDEDEPTINKAYHFIYNYITQLNELYDSKVLYNYKLIEYCESKNITVSI